MNAFAVLYGGSLTEYAFERVFDGRCALDLALEQAAAFPGVARTALLAGPLFDSFADASGWKRPSGVRIIPAASWTKKTLLETLSSESGGFDLGYFAWADAPFLDPDLTGALAGRHRKYAAEYSYADGWPYGFAPEILAPGVAGILAKILGGDDGAVERDALFSVIQKDINAFDIETEISAADLRSHRLSFTADSKRNFLLLRRFAESGFKSARDAEKFIAEKPGLLRTLPAFYAVQVSGPCAQACRLCPYPKYGALGGLSVTERRDFLDPAKFRALLDKITAFSGDAVIDLSLWGELALHPEKLDLVNMALERPGLSLIVETSGLGWKPEEFEALAAKSAAAAAGRPFKSWAAPKSPLSWVLSLDAPTPGRYRELRGDGFEEATAAAKLLLDLFPEDTYLQALRTRGAEDDVEAFYRRWTAEPLSSGGAVGKANVIIQKFDDFCGALPKLQASDLSPVERQCCWHLLRDMDILIDGRVPLCREDLQALNGRTPPESPAQIMGNAFDEALETIWERGLERCLEQGAGRYTGICAGCDEYYTFNF
ncbi:MAG: spiro-SPASM protein [Spirochaetaceae bacterium]|jgi:spiro-SPASM protein|nr:spiro-SPASM protein [Spirochaetaceae bacterium]